MSEAAHACPIIAALIPATSGFRGTACQAGTLSFSESGRGTRRTNMLKCLLAVAALVVSGGLSLAQTEQGPPSAQQGTAPAPHGQPRLDAEGYNMDKPAPPATTGPVKKSRSERGLYSGSGGCREPHRDHGRSARKLREITANPQRGRRTPALGCRGMLLKNRRHRGGAGRQAR